jgi:hypothetical protein
MASISICSSLKSRDPEHLASIRKWWKTSPVLTSQVKKAIHCTVHCEDIILRNQSSHAFALILAIEGEECVETLTTISQNLETIPIEVCGLLRIFLEILHLARFEIELKTPVLLKCYHPFWIQALSLLGKSAPIHDMLRFVAVECIRDAIF